MIGYEPSEEVAKIARLTLKTYAAGSGYIVHPTLFDGCGEQAGKVTLITMSHVIEHIATPHSTLITLAKCLMPGGYAFLAVPNRPLRIIEHEVNTQGTRGVGFQGDYKPKHNFHLFYFSERSLRVFIHSGHNSTFSIVDSVSNSQEARMLLRRRI
jgi:2-polyprenyl-3-methyl-5-hydroxy-6-metoxy-1,4-benzoquinol methylase